MGLLQLEVQRILGNDSTWRGWYLVRVGDSMQPSFVQLRFY